MALVKNHPLRRKWTYLRQVVNNPHCPDYDPNLEVEGIDNFRYFAEWVEADIGPRPDKPGDILVRQNRQRGFVPGNIMWADSRAKSYTLDQYTRIRFRRQTKFIRHWAEELDISYHVLYRKIRQGWSIPKIIKYAQAHGYSYR